MSSTCLRLPSLLTSLRGGGILAALLWAVAAQAAVKLSNLETAATGTATVSAVNYKAQPFRTTASGPFEITLVTLRMRKKSG